jgi:hypothetical protein
LLLACGLSYDLFLSNPAVRVSFAAEIQQEISAAWWWQTMLAKQQPPEEIP